jgi:hypothetical protein
VNFISSLIKDFSFLCVSFRVLWKIFQFSVFGVFRVFDLKCSSWFFAFACFISSHIKDSSVLSVLLEVVFKIFQSSVKSWLICNLEDFNFFLFERPKTSKIMALFSSSWLMQINVNLDANLNVNAANPTSLAEAISKYSLSCPKWLSECLSDRHSHLSISVFSSSHYFQSRVCFVWGVLKHFSFMCVLSVSFEMVWKIVQFGVVCVKCSERLFCFA